MGSISCLSLVLYGIKIGGFHGKNEFVFSGAIIVSITVIWAHCSPWSTLVYFVFLRASFPVTRWIKRSSRVGRNFLNFSSLPNGDICQPLLLIALNTAATIRLDTTLPLSPPIWYFILVLTFNSIRCLLESEQNLFVTHNGKENSISD